MTQEQKGLEPDKNFNFSNSGTVKYVGVDGATGLNKFVPVKGNFSGEAIILTDHQVRLLVRPITPTQKKP